MAKTSRVERPLRKSEYEIVYASTHAQKGWRDLKATIPGPLVDTWEWLTKTPLEVSPSNYRLRGELGNLTYQEKQFDRWQHKPTLKGSARIWFFVDENDRRVYLEKVLRLIQKSHPQPKTPTPAPEENTRPYNPNGRLNPV